MNGVIYKAVNRFNQKIYIGQSWNFYKRKNEHLNQAIAGYYDYPFHQAIRKYGKENFDWEILCECFTQEDLNFAEQVFIDYYGGINDKRNYNAREGGSLGKLSNETKIKISKANSGSRNYMFGKTHSKKTRKIISKTHKGRSLTEEHRRKIGEAGIGRIVSCETRNKMSKNNKGENHPLYGKPVSKETREKIGIANTGKTHTEETKRKISLATKGHTPSNKVFINPNIIIDNVINNKEITGSALAIILDINRGTLYKIIKRLFGYKSFTEFKASIYVG